MGLFEKKSTFRKFIDSITNAIYDNPDLGPEFMEELETANNNPEIIAELVKKAMEKREKKSSKDEEKE